MAKEIFGLFCFSDADEKTWYWDFEGHKLTYPSNSVVRFRVAEIRYTKPERRLLLKRAVGLPGHRQLFTVVSCLVVLRHTEQV